MLLCPTSLRSWFILALVLVLTGAPTTSKARPEERFAAIVLDAETGETLYARHADARRYPASLTKVMTLFLAFDAIEAGGLKASDAVVISPRAASRPPSRLGLTAGDRLTVRQAMDVMVVKSANDLATALAETLGGSEAAFARTMTAKAQELGMAHTRFVNASGLPDPRHYSTARDLAILGRAFLREHPHDYAIFNQQQTTFRGRQILGHNALLARPEIDGFKTGFVNASGFNLLTSGVLDGHRVIAVVLGGRTARTRDAFMARLMRAAFASLSIRDAGTDLSVAALMDTEDVMFADRSGEASPRPVLVAAQTGGDQVEQGQGDTDAGAKPNANPGRWWIQVGAFHQRDVGRRKLREVSQRHPRRFADRDRQVVASGNLFAARFAALSRSGAKAACAVLVADGEECLALLE